MRYEPNGRFASPGLEVHASGFAMNDEALEPLRADDNYQCPREYGVWVLIRDQRDHDPGDACGRCTPASWPCVVLERNIAHVEAQRCEMTSARFACLRLGTPTSRTRLSSQKGKPGRGRSVRRRVSRRP